KARGQALHHLYYRLGEAVKYNSMKEICLVVRGQVHDITHFLNEHPSGEEVLLEQTGAGASESFENVGHSSEATEMLKWHDIGDVHPNDLKPESSSKEPSKDTMCKSCWSYWILPIIGPIVLGFLYCYYTWEGK
ncbi:CYB5B protein, partial [Crocuta crocuta]